MEWQPIETAPKRGLFLGYFGEDAGFIHKARFCLCFWHDGRGIFISTGLIHAMKLRDKDTQPTHWMPLPEPPHPTK